MYSNCPGKNTSNGQIYGYPYAANPLSATYQQLWARMGPIRLCRSRTARDIMSWALRCKSPIRRSPAFTSVNGIAATPTALAASPDGNYAVVGAGDVYVLSASSYQVLLDTTTGGTIVGIAISQDSQNAYVLSNAPYGSIVTQISLADEDQSRDAAATHRRSHFYRIFSARAALCRRHQPRL